jgi:hypothetical protein
MVGAGNLLASRHKWFKFFNFRFRFNNNNFNWRWWRWSMANNGGAHGGSGGGGGHFRNAPNVYHAGGLETLQVQHQVKEIMVVMQVSTS